VSEPLSRWLRDSCADVWEPLRRHPFLREMASGTLPLASFRFYLEQDTYYLAEYARCMAIGAAKARDIREVRWLRDSLDNVIDNEIPGNEALLERVVAMGAEDERGTAAMAPATLAYTSHLLATAHQGDALDVMVAIMPCAWSYREIGLELAPDIEPSSFYADWLRFWVSDFYGDRVARMLEELDEMGAAADAARRERLRGVFLTSTRLEWAFWDMAHHRRQWPDLRLRLCNTDQIPST
jgi:thiaminase/transcriptional activator TenA